MRRTVGALGMTMLMAFGLVGCGKKEAVRPVPEAPAAAEGSAAASAKPEAAKPEEVVRPPHDQPPTAVQWDAPAVTGDWAGYQGGPTRSGRREVAPITKPVIAWSAQVGIQGYANTVLTSGDTIFLGSQGEFWNKPDKADSVIALRAADGRQIWRVPTDSDVNGTMLAKDLVIAVTDSGTVYAIQRTSGEIKWQLGAECGMQHPPVQVGDELVFTREEGVTTVSLETGKIVDALTACRRSQRTAISAADGVAYAVHPREGLMAYAAGKPLWKLERPDPELTGFTAWQPPYVGKELLLQTFQRWSFKTESGARSFEPAMVAVWRDNGQVAWAARVNSPELANKQGNLPGDPHYKQAPFVADGSLFAVSGSGGYLQSFSLLDGTRTGELAFSDCRSRQFGGIAGATGVGYLTRHDGVVYAFSTRDMKWLWTRSLGLHAVAGGKSTHSQAPSGCSPEPQDGSALFAAPTVGEDGTLYVGTADGWLYAIRQAP